ncbi:MAG: lipid kinase [Desulfobacterales bacterium]
MKTKRALILINKKAREGEADLRATREILAAGGITSVVHAFKDVAEIEAAVKSHQAAADRIVVGGGDGTLNAALEAVLASGLPLGVLPMGTANDLARTLQIPSVPEEAAGIIVRGRLTRIDLGWVNGKHYVNVAHIGLAARVSHILTTEMKKRWSVLAYPLALFEAYRTNRPFRARVTCDGRAQTLKSIQIAIGNGRHYGGGMSVRHDAHIDDHRLNFYSLEPKNLLHLLAAAPAIARGTFRRGDPVRLMDGKEIKVATSRVMQVDTDGELVARTPAVFRVKAAALPIFVP